MKCFKICYILGICVVLSFFIIYCFNFSVMSYFIPTRTRRGHSLYIREKIPNVARNEKQKKLSGFSFSNIRRIFMVRPIRSTWTQRSKARACPGSRFLDSTHHYSTQCIRRQSFFFGIYYCQSHAWFVLLPKRYFYLWSLVFTSCKWHAKQSNKKYLFTLSQL